MNRGINNPGFRALPQSVQSKIISNMKYGGRMYAGGGNLDQLTEFTEGGTHEENPIGGIPQGTAPNGQMNLVEQGETKLNKQNYIFSDQLKIDGNTVAQFNLPKSYIGKTFADASKKLDKPNSRRENDTIEMADTERNLNKLKEAQEFHKQQEVQKKIDEIMALDPNALASMMGQGQQGQPSMEPPMDPQMIPQEGMMKYGGDLRNPPPSDTIYYGPGDSEYDMRLRPLNMDIMEKNYNLYREDQKNIIPDSEMQFMYNQWNKNARTGKLGAVQAKNGGYINTNQFGNGGGYTLSNPNNLQQPPSEYMYPASAIDPRYGVLSHFETKGEAEEYLLRDNGTSRAYYNNPLTGEVGELIGDNDNYYTTGTDLSGARSARIARENITNMYPQPGDNGEVGPYYSQNQDTNFQSAGAGRPYANPFGKPYDWQNYPASGYPYEKQFSKEAPNRFFTKNPDSLINLEIEDYKSPYYERPKANQKDLGGFMKDNKQGILGGLQAAAGIGAMFIPGAQGLGANLIGGGIGNITGEIKGDQQAEMQKKAMDQQQLLAKQQANMLPQQGLDPYGNPIAPQGMYSRYGGKIYNVGGYMNGGYVDNLPDENNMIDPSDIASTGGFLETRPNTTFAKGGNMYDNGGGFTKGVPNSYLQTAPLDFKSTIPTFSNTEEEKKGNYADVGDLSDTTMDLSINQSPLDFGLQLAPIAWNLAKGLQKPMEFKGEDFYTKIDPTLVDYTNAENTAKETGAGAMKSIKNTVPGGGSYASNVLATQQNINKALTEIDTLEANTNSKLKGDADKLNITRKDAANMEALKMNLATQQAKELLQQEALTQGKGLSEQAIANKLAQNYAVMSAPDISRFKKVGYNPYYQQVLESIKNRKTTPKI
jgi:hypothetical protein